MMVATSGHRLAGDPPDIFTKRTPSRQFILRHDAHRRRHQRHRWTPGGSNRPQDRVDNRTQLTRVGLRRRGQHRSFAVVLPAPRRHRRRLRLHAAVALRHHVRPLAQPARLGRKSGLCHLWHRRRHRRRVGEPDHCRLRLARCIHHRRHHRRRRHAVAALLDTRHPSETHGSAIRLLPRCPVVFDFNSRARGIYRRLGVLGFGGVDTDAPAQRQASQSSRNWLDHGHPERRQHDRLIYSRQFVRHVRPPAHHCAERLSRSGGGLCFVLLAAIDRCLSPSASPSSASSKLPCRRWSSPSPKKPRRRATPAPPAASSWRSTTSPASSRR